MATTIYDLPLVTPETFDKALVHARMIDILDHTIGMSITKIVTTEDQDEARDHIGKAYQADLSSTGFMDSNGLDIARVTAEVNTKGDEDSAFWQFEAFTRTSEPGFNESSVRQRGRVVYDEHLDHFSTWSEFSWSPEPFARSGPGTKGAAVGGLDNEAVGTLNEGWLSVAGTIWKNASAYDNPDYVLEHHFTGNIVKFKNNPGADTYAGVMPLPDIQEYAKAHHHLPRVDDKPSGAFKRADVSLEYVEELMLRVLDLEDRVVKLASDNSVALEEFNANP